MSEFICIYIGLKLKFSYCCGSVRISVTGPTEVCAKTGFKYYTHTITNGKKAELKFAIPSADEPEKYTCLKLCKNGDRECQDETLCYTPGDNGNGKVYVYFYCGDTGARTSKSDPRPLMLCYNGHAYAPKDKVNYDKQWVKVDIGQGCECQPGNECDPEKCKLLEQLTKVVGFLNEVDLKQHPRNGDRPKEYEVHKYLSKPIQIQVTKQAVNGGQCYHKVIHQPAGIRGGKDNGDGYRLGNITYKANGLGKPTGKIDYTSKGECRFLPLVSVTAYFYDHDKQHKDPLLVELEFKGSGTDGQCQKEYYKLNSRNERTMSWTKDPDASTKVEGNGQELVTYLDEIRYGLKKVVKIQIDKHRAYILMASQNPGGGGSFEQLNGQKIKVEVECVQCPELKKSDYKCYKHDLKELTSHQQEIGGVKFFISGNGGKDIELHLFKDPGEEDEEEDETELYEIKLPYNTCTKDVYVYFYQEDKVPLLLFYNKKWFSPLSRNNYFDLWLEESFLKVVTEPSCMANDENCRLLNIVLDMANSILNQIDLDPSKVVQRSYGIPPPIDGKKPKFDLKRIKVAMQKHNSNYNRVVHRTKNSFTIGELYYNGKNVINHGINIKKGMGPIKVASGSGHTSFIVGDNKPNTVVVYYSKTDVSHKLPQLIVILKTDEAIRGGPGTITSSRGTKYGYYILSTGKTGSGYEYKWREVQKQEKGVTLDDATEFSLLNSAVILLDKQTQYLETEISSAIKEIITMRSPGNISDINRIKEKTISVSEATTNGPGIGGGTCLTKFGYKVITHDITGLVTPGSPLEKLGGVTMIAGLRFIVPSETEKDKYREVTLCQKNGGPGECSGQVDYLYHQGLHNKVYVYFFKGISTSTGVSQNGGSSTTGGDPRPLLLCYNGKAYKPKKMSHPFRVSQVVVKYDLWVKVDNINRCDCAGTTNGNTDLLKELTQVVGFLNPVQLNPKQVPSGASETITKEPPSPPPPKPIQATYELHEFPKGSKIQMKVSWDTITCYRKFTYEPDGINGSNGKGFRLGNVVYSKNESDKPIGTLDYTTTSDHKYHPLKKASVYYYQEDKEYCDPLLVELEFNGAPSSNSKEYYKLTTRESTGNGTVEWKLDKAQTNQLGQTDKLVSYLDKIRYALKKALKIEIRHNSSKMYQVQLSQNKGGQGPFEALNGTKNIQVTQGPICSALTGTGYKCYKHEISSLDSEDHHKIGGLKFFIPGSESSEEKEINLYEQGNGAGNGQCNTENPGSSTQALYNKCMGDIYVYFYSGTATQGVSNTSTGDPRPLLVCYGKYGYRPVDMGKYFSQWVKVKDLEVVKNGCGCPGSTPATGTNGKCDTLLEALVCVSNFLNPVDIQQVPKEKPPSSTHHSYNIHRFNGQDIQITVTAVLSKDKFCYNKYTHKPSTGYRLGRIDYGSNGQGDSKCIQVNGSTSGGKCINAVLEEPPGKSLSASEVAVYYYKGDPRHERPLLVALCSSGGSGVACNLYYTLQKGDSKNKKYKKETTSLDLNDTSSGSDLENVLDEALSGVSKSLQVILSEQPKQEIECYPIDYDFTCEPEIKPIKESLVSSCPGDYIVGDITTPKYRAQVYDSSDSPQTGDTRSIEVNEVQCKGVASGGYRCFQHQISKVKDVHDIGGLRLFLWDSRGSSNNGSGGSNGEITLKNGDTDSGGIPYTTCKGDIYVYFYGDDPRPLLVCYSGVGYKPQGLEQYTQEWQKASGVKCECKKGEDTGPLLQALYEVSMFMNPVKLCETQTAGSTLTRQQKSMDQPKKEPTHTYPVHSEYKPNPVSVTITGLDLNCYKRYTHRPKLGYRLGQVNWNGTQAQGVTYTQSKQLLSVSLYYYMYDKDHENPLIVELGYKGELSDYYRLKEKEDEPTWEKMKSFLCVFSLIHIRIYKLLQYYYLKTSISTSHYV